MALAKWAGLEEPKPYSLYTRREVDEWILPQITRNDTMLSVLERYIYLLANYYCSVLVKY